VQMQAKLKLDRAGILRRIREVISYAADSGMRVAMGGEDSSRAEMDFLFLALEEAARAGAHRYRYADKLGHMEPFAICDAFTKLRRETSLELEFHGHDDLGLATANTLAAVRGGATHASVCVLGLGERAGNASLEEVSAGLNRFHSTGSSVNLETLPRLAELVSRAARRPIPVGQAIIGANAFTHESGIHVDGLLKDPSTYESLSPQTFGREREIVLGKHSGMASITDALHALGLPADRDRTQWVLARVRQRSMQAKRIVSTEELLHFYRCSGNRTSADNNPKEIHYDCA